MITNKLEIVYLKMILNFGIQTSVASLLYYILDWSDRILIKNLLNISDAGIYSLGYKLGSIMNVFIIMPFALVWAPLRMRLAKNVNLSIFTGKVVSYYTIVGVMVMVSAILFGGDVMNLIFINKSYASAAKIFPIIMFSLFFYGYQNIVDYGIYLNQKVHFYILISTFAILFNVIMNFWLLPIWGFIAAAYITLFTYIITSTSIYVISNIYFNIKVEKKRVLCALFIVPVLYQFIYSFSINNFCIKLCVLFIVYFLIFKYWLNKNERSYLTKLAANFIRK